MNYYGARQREKDQRWDFTRMNDGHVIPVGYCRPYTEWWTLPHNQREINLYRSNKHKYHTDGHATKEEAAECYRQYQIDHNVQYDHKDNSQQRKCAVCSEWTQNFVTDNHSFLVFLCDTHRNREEVEKLYPKIDEIWSSY